MLILYPATFWNYLSLLRVFWWSHRVSYVKDQIVKNNLTSPFPIGVLFFFLCRCLSSDLEDYIEHKWREFSGKKKNNNTKTSFLSLMKKKALFPPFTIMLG